MCKFVSPSQCLQLAPKSVKFKGQITQRVSRNSRNSDCRLTVKSAINIYAAFWLCGSCFMAPCREEFVATVSSFPQRSLCHRTCVQMSERELKPNGKSIPVTNANKREYVE